ncbi:stromal cell-derived factor 2-like [Bufo bufo]|uniref:stromal cell-derived factor 2-like n=1 Tax=Bufo bufo TaxID=8384 RepID=UPI001ABDE890|nr:stromal cell-derived factor 2-like [Bufo bufo]XP_040269194.1 stromal cell-derived factor 2-like [Bufo bufo]XP_040269457.1 stromal cell-derived factor 2-like [Bufo bufo]XP_040278049.1 stromal cell-derived factor 2-like [Bufo bufo]XP_040278050.1 stromal cell-derived factor 2-like [Bufo bufo]
MPMSPAVAPIQVPIRYVPASLGLGFSIVRVSKVIVPYLLTPGSGQQSVTGVTAADDGNSYWRIRGKTSTVCERGTLVKCGHSIRLTHVNTGRNLHSHHFTSPLSGNQEVSAFGDDGEGDILDDWTVLCNGEFWQRNEEVRFKHASTNVLLSVTGEQYGRPINGQREVHGMTYAGPHNYWKVMEGIFMKPSEPPRTDFTHSEL